MKRHAVIKDGKVHNVIIWDGQTNWAPPEGYIVVQHDQVQIGDEYNHATRAIIHKGNYKKM